MGSGYQDCPYCKGMAQMKSPETMSLEAIQLASTREIVQRVEITVASPVSANSHLDGRNLSVSRALILIPNRLIL